MAAARLTPRKMAKMHPDLFRTASPPVATFAEQHAAALDALAAVRQPMPPAACQLLAQYQAAAQNELHMKLATRSWPDRRLAGKAKPGVVGQGA